MSLNLRILLFIFSLIWFVIIFILLKNDKIPIRYSLVWFLSAFVLFLLAIFPNLFLSATRLIGFETTSNLIIGIILCLLLIITMVLTIIVSNQNKKIILLIQEISMLKGKEK